MKLTLERVLWFIPLVISLVAGALMIGVLYHGDEKMELEASLQATYIDPLFWITFICAGAGVLAALVFTVIQIATHHSQKQLIRMGINIGVLGVIAAIAYGASSGDVSGFAEGTTEGEVKWSGTGLITFYILAALAILSIVYAEVTNALK